MNTISNMKELCNIFYKFLQAERFDHELAHGFFKQLEQNFYEALQNEGVIFERKDAMMLALESEAKQEVQLLEEKLRQGSSLATVQEQTGRLARLVKEFWHEAGFHYVKEFSVNDSGSVEMELGFSLNYGTFASDKPVSAKEAQQKTTERLVQEGYVLNEKGTALVDCDSNKEKITQLLSQRFPSVAIISWKTRIDNLKTRQHNIRSMDVRLSKIEEILHIKTPH